MKSAVSMYISLCISFITSFSLEFLQYISKRGHFETEDIILNTLGGFLGCIIYLVLYSIYKLFKSHLNTDA
jgi:glycopeptide antibiotics resistance protein